MANRLHETIAVVCPIDGVVYDIEQQQVLRIDYSSEATAQQRIDADNVAASFDWSNLAQVAWQKQKDRDIIIALLSNADRTTKLLVSFILVCLDEFNRHADKHNAILTAADNATNLSDFKARMATIPDFPQRTKQNLLDAMITAIQSGLID